MPHLTKQDIENIARLARLKLTEQEKEKYTKELSAILEYVGALKKVNTTDVPPTAQVTGLTNVLAEDTVHGCDIETRGELLNAAPERAGEYVKVPPVFE